MRKFVAALLIPVFLFVGGCASDAELRVQTAQTNFELVKSQAKALQVPLLQAAIPFPDGSVAQIVVANPLTNQMKPLRMPEDPAMRVFDRLVGVAGTAAGIWLGGEAATSIIEATGKVAVGALSKVPQPVQFNQPAPIVGPSPEVVITPAPEVHVVEQPPYNEPVIVEPVVVEPVVVEGEI